MGDPEPQGHPGATSALAWLRGAGRSLAQSPPTLAALFQDLFFHPVDMRVASRGALRVSKIKMQINRLTRLLGPPTTLPARAALNFKFHFPIAFQ